MKKVLGAIVLVGIILATSGGAALASEELLAAPQISSVANPAPTTKLPWDPAVPPRLLCSGDDCDCGVILIECIANCSGQPASCNNACSQENHWCALACCGGGD